MTVRFRPSTLFVTMLLSGCAGTFEAYEGAQTADSELAVVRAAVVCSIMKDGYSYYHWSRDGRVGRINEVGTIKLRPGQYEIAYAGSPCARAHEVSYTDTLELVAGHNYRAAYATRGSGLFGQTTYLWFEDETTGQVIAHAKP